MTTPTASLVPRRRPFAAIRKGLVEHVLRGRLNATQLGVYVWLHLLVDHTTGTVRTNATRLSSELRIHPVTVRRHLAALKQNGYLRYAATRGSGQLYEIAIEKYDRHFEGQARALHGSLQGRLHVRAANARSGNENRVAKKKDVRSTAPLRVRFADPERSDRDLLSRGKTRGRARQDVHPRADGPAPADAQSRDTLMREDVDARTPADAQTRESGSGPAPAGTLTRADALAQAPAVMRETLELFCLKTGRDTITSGELEALRALEAAHTPAVIQRAITKAVDRFTGRGELASAVTLDYVHQSLQYFTTRTRTGARRDAIPPPSYPAGVTRLR